MKSKRNSFGIVKLIALTSFVLIEACDSCGFSERCYEERERKRFLNLSSEQQKEELEECKKRAPVSCYTYSKPTLEEVKN